MTWTIESDVHPHHEPGPGCLDGTRVFPLEERDDEQDSSIIRTGGRLVSPLGGFGGGGTGLGAGLGLGMLITPIMIASMILRRPASPVRKLIQAGATSPDTARKLRGLGIPRELPLRPALRRGIVRKLDDGRWYVDLERDRQVRLRMLVIVCLLALLLALGIWFGFQLLQEGEPGLP